MQPPQQVQTPPAAPMLHTLLRQYGAWAGEPLDCARVSQGLLNRGYRLTTTRGLFFLKHHLDGDARAVARRHRAVVRLGALGVPVVPPVPDTGGRTVAVVDGGCWALHPWVDGRHRQGGELSVAQSGRLGALLGRVHTGLDKAMPTASGDTHGHTAESARGRNPGRASGHVSADPADTCALIGELLTRVRSRRSPDSFDLLAEHRLRERRLLLHRHAASRPPEATVPSAGWVHGDFHPLNLLYRRAPSGSPDGRVAIVDWDRLGVQPRAEEAVRGAVIFFVRPDGTLDPTRVRAYARGYRRGTGAVSGDMAAAVHRVWWERLNDFWMLRWRYQLCDIRADPLFPAAAALAVWWTRHYEEVRDAFCG